MKKLLLLLALMSTFALSSVHAQSSKYYPSCSKKSVDKLLDQKADLYDTDVQLIDDKSKKKKCTKSISPSSKYKNMSAKMVSNTSKSRLSIAQKAACTQASLKTKAAKASRLAKLDGV